MMKNSSCVLLNFELDAHAGNGCAELAGLEYPLHVFVDIRQVAGCYLQGHGLGLAGCEFYLVKGTQSLHIGRECGHEVGNVKEHRFFYGTVGIGKSFLSGCVAQELIEKGYSCFYYSAIELFAQISKETFHTSQKDDLYNLLDYLYNCDLLIIDDLGTENTNSFVSSQLFSIINERSLRKRSTIISTNLSLQELRERYSDRVFSRIVTSFNIVHLSGNDIRIAKRTSTS